MLDELRRDIQTRLEELLAEAEKLRHALAALTSRDGASSPEANVATSPRRRARPGSPSPAATGQSARPRRSASSRSTAAGVAQATAQTQGAARSNDTASTRTAPGATKTAVLKALANGSAMTASEVAKQTGLGRASVSTTLSKLAKSGELTKAARGYQIAAPSSTE
jgi:DNA-binding transcriptional ArsR family regulator